MEKYKIAKKEDKKTIYQTKSKTYETLHNKLETKEVRRIYVCVYVCLYVYMLAKMRERKSRDLGNVKCIKSKN